MNEALEDEPGLVNSSPMEAGWMIKVKLQGTPPQDLMDQAAYDEYLTTLDEE